MSENSKIQWTHHTFNPWRGCTKATWTDADGKTRLHPGCLNCYAEVDMSVKLHGIKWGKGQERVPKADSGWGEPLRWARKAAAAGERHRVFCASLADVLDDEVPDAMRERLWDTIRKTAFPLGGRVWMEPGLDWLLLTKRPENWRLVPEDVRPLVWLGTSVSDQETVDEWIPHLLEAEGFRYRFLSVEPLVGPVDLRPWMRGRDGGSCVTCGGTGEIEDETHPAHPKNTGDGHDETWCTDCDGDGVERGLSWVIVGGESGAKARPCNVEWIRNIVRQCAEAGVACFVKQLGALPMQERTMRSAGTEPRTQEAPLILMDAKGGDWSEWPEDLRVRQFPGDA